ncbi:hypothetical protein IE53DRAFT_389115 [Violaceomyces palustris]|uniref:Uncharacterized protein n=1 Tax=Violaceomyces palustris TaxID=1673888 RepID=A0ACD0NSE2_9BASI|nr:hypothetical protein IE53DRAFT_389115 [Violaceomyces palustris]
MESFLQLGAARPPSLTNPPLLCPTVERDTLRHYKGYSRNSNPVYPSLHFVSHPIHPFISFAHSQQDLLGSSTIISRRRSPC